LGAIHIIGENFVLPPLTVKEAEHDVFVFSTANVNPCLPALQVKSSASLPFGPNLKEPTLDPSIETSITPGGFQGWLVANIVQLKFCPCCTGSPDCVELDILGIAGAGTSVSRDAGES